MATQIQGIDTEYKPWGLTAGAMVGERQADTDAANLLALQESQLGNVLKQRDAMEAQGQMQNPEWLKWKLAGQMGEGMSKGATGAFDQGVLKDKMATSIADFQAKRGTDELTKVANSLQMIKLSSQENGPLNGILSLKGKVPDKLLQFALQNPGEVDKIYEGVMNTLAKTPKLRGDMMAKDREYENQEIIHQGDRTSHEKIAAGNNAASRYAADQRKVDSQASERKYDQTLLKANPEARLGIVKAAIQSRLHPYSSEPLTQEQLGRYEAMYSQDVATVNAKNNANTQNKPNLGGMGVNAFPQSNVGSPSQGTRPPLSSFNK